MPDEIEESTGKGVRAKRVVRAAAAAKIDKPYEMVEPRELVEAAFGPGLSPSLLARRALLLMVATAAQDGFTDTTYRLSKLELRQNHESNDRIPAVLHELLRIDLAIPSLSSRGRAARTGSHLFERITEETDAGDDAWVEFEFTKAARAVFGGSEVYAALNRTAVLAFEGKYAITLYQLGCLYAGRRSPEIRMAIPELRQRLGVPDGHYSDWAQINRRVIKPAIEEINQLAHFEASCHEHRRGRSVIAVTLGFWRKSDAQIDAAARELERSRVGRKQRRAAAQPIEQRATGYTLAPVSTPRLPTKILDDDILF